MTRSVMAILCMALVGATACKKENDSIAFNPEGYWRGSAYLFHTAILNQPGGASRIYVKIPGMDTAQAELKAGGSYTLSGNYFRADYPYGDGKLIIESYSPASPMLKGTLILLSGEIVPFELIKQN